MLFLLVKTVHLDCGCNSLKREENTKLQETCDATATATENLNTKIYNADLSLIPGGEYIIGAADAVFPNDRESPERSVKIKDFLMDKYEVSNWRFKVFVEATNYITDAEKFNDSFIFEALLTNDQKESHKDFRVVSAPWWYKVNGVSWKHPHGPESSLDGMF